ncbi:unnamed protein product [Brachionus calyciflorus]|uniref:DUF268 domain-containing protein n=1 Tax=Brachionus calyciflorus TaxID=104777 RepID=A0A814BAF2_9BILA|nr:unnamed protein product [Brachionus calyciflorus]
MRSNNLKLFLTILFILIIFLIYNEKTKKENLQVTISKKFYQLKCITLYKKQRNPDPKLIKRPPVKEIPTEMFDEFTMNGKMLVSYYYKNEAYTDSSSNDRKINHEYSIMEIAKLVEIAKNNQPQPNYGDIILNDLMKNYSSFVKDKSVVVIGTQLPWVEAIAYYHGASYITTLDYTRKKYRIANMSWYHVNDFLDEYIENNKIEEFDVALSFSSIEHSGLGRYGDPLNPNGDFDAVQQMHCLLKSGGLLFLAVPESGDGTSRIEFNLHRIYGKDRLEILFKGWKLLKRIKDSSGFHGIYVLEKL